MKRKPKHVIFLGAGASATSRYPVADQLRKDWLSSKQALLSKVLEQVPQYPNTLKRENESGEIERMFNEWYESSAASLALFRKGGFGTIDEFCYHARHSKHDEVQKLKNVLRFALGIHDPEVHFNLSDYYTLLQKLFLTESLSTLRDDIVILSFNYDPYLEWLLIRALEVRMAQLDGKRKEFHIAASKVTSGFYGGKGGLHTLIEDDGFCVLKLHGIIAWPGESGDEQPKKHNPFVSFNDIFTGNVAVRTERLSGLAGDTVTPIVFPWEVIDGNGRFVTDSNFSVKESGNFELHGIPQRAGGRTAADPTIHNIFETIWTRAREEVLAASKISFVGLSMHSYLKIGFRYLFEGRTIPTVWTITDSRSVDVNPPEATSPTAKAIDLFSSLNVQVKRPTIRQNFADFIEHEISYATQLGKT